MTSLVRAVDDVLAASPEAVLGYRSGKSYLGWFVGQVLKCTQGVYTPLEINRILIERLDD